jgi:hypothetical protein
MSEVLPFVPRCPVHAEVIGLDFKGVHHGREHWKCRKCSFFLHRLATLTADEIARLTSAPAADQPPHDHANTPH